MYFFFFFLCYSVFTLEADVQTIVSAAFAFSLSWIATLPEVIKCSD